MQCDVVGCSFQRRYSLLAYVPVAENLQEMVDSVMKKIGIAFVESLKGIGCLPLKRLAVDKSLQFLMQSIYQARFAFPDDGNTPSLVYQAVYVGFISFFVPSQFALPKFLSRFRHCSPFASIMLMPKASMHEYGQSEFWQDDIRSSRQIFAVQAEAKPHGMKLFSDKDFWFSILRLNFCHHPTAFGRDRRIVAVPHLCSLLDARHASTAGRGHASMVMA